MKIKSLLLALAALTLLACEQDNTPKTITPEDGSYTGTVIVQTKNGPFENTDIKVDFTPSEDGATATIVMHKVKFAAGMPMSLDMTIPGVTLTSDAEKVSISGDNIIPLALGGEFPQYTVTELTGQVLGEDLTLSMKLGGTATTFTGSQTGLPLAE